MSSTAKTLVDQLSVPEQKIVTPDGATRKLGGLLDLTQSRHFELIQCSLPFVTGWRLSGGPWTVFIGLVAPHDALRLASVCKSLEPRVINNNAFWRNACHQMYPFVVCRNTCNVSLRIAS